ncbi:MAG TPA: ankyrin repeat domain-containing protein [Chthonomonadaceae bacterium]|nr:ankyrin repeat domain-containing protein [Chthonomonadaceae bacterium]
MKPVRTRSLFWWVILALLSGGGICRADDPQDLRSLAVQTGALSSPVKLTEFLTAHPEAAKAADRYSGFTLLHDAAMDGGDKRFALVQALLDRGADINAASREGITPLREAMRYNRRDIGEFLVAKGAYLDVFSACALKNRARVAQLLQENPKLVSARDEYGWTPLWWALDADAMDIAELLLAKGADVNAKEEPDPKEHWPNGETPIFRVIRGERLDQVKFLIAHGADLNVQERSNNYTPLLETNLYGRQPQIFALLLEHGADPNLPNSQGLTPLHMARTAEDAALLIAHGAKVDVRDKLGRTPLFTCQSPEIAVFLVEHGADVNARANDRSTPLFWAGSKAISEYLLSKGANLHALTRGGSTPLHTAAGSRHPDLVEYLIAQGLDVNARNYQGRTPLFQAAASNDKAMVELLVARGADINVKDAQGETSIHSIAPDTPAGKEIAAFLLSKGAEADIFAAIILGMTDRVAALLKADPRLANAMTPHRRTALHIAAESGNKEIVALLLESGADVHAGDPFHYGATAISLTRDHKEVADLLLAWEKSHPAPPKPR